MKNNDLNELDILSKDDFEFFAEKPGGIRKGGIYKSKKDNNVKLLIKSDELQYVIHDYVSSFILHQINPDKVPVNYIVKSADEIFTGSKIIDDFVTIGSYASQHDNLKEFYNRGCLLTIGSLERATKYCPDLQFDNLFFSPQVVESNLLANFIKMNDYNTGNIGFIIKDNEIKDSAIIDFSFSLGVRTQKANPSNKYYAGIDHALSVLEKISSFNPKKLDELKPIMEKLKSDQKLKKIQNLMIEQLSYNNKQIQACKLAKKIIANNFTDKELSDFLSTKVPISNFELKDGENFLLSSLYKNNDAPSIAKILTQDSSSYRYFIDLYFKNTQNILFDQILSKLDVNILKAMTLPMLEQAQDSKDLTILSKLLLITNDQKFDPYNVIKNYLTQKKISGTLFQKEYDTHYRYVESKIYYQLIRIGLTERKFSDMASGWDYDYVGNHYPGRSFLSEDLYNLEAVKYIVSFLDLDRKKYIIEKLFKNREYATIKEIFADAKMNQESLKTIESYLIKVSSKEKVEESGLFQELNQQCKAEERAKAEAKTKAANDERVKKQEELKILIEESKKDKKDLYNSIETKDLTKITSILDKNSNLINVKDSAKGTLLAHAVVKGAKDVIEFLLNKKAKFAVSDFTSKKENILEDFMNKLIISCDNHACKEAFEGNFENVLPGQACKTSFDDFCLIKELYHF